MKELSQAQWADFKIRYYRRPCNFCKENGYDLTELKVVSVAGIDVVPVICTNCGHVDFFAVDKIFPVSDKGGISDEAAQAIQELFPD